MEAGQSCANGQTTESRFGDGCINHSLRPESVQKPLGHLVGTYASHVSQYGIVLCSKTPTIILGNFLAHDEDFVIQFQLLCESFIERISDREGLVRL